MPERAVLASRVVYSGMARQEELVRLGERVGVAEEESRLYEEQCAACKAQVALLQTELRMAYAAATAAKNDARDEQMLRHAHEGRVQPLRDALKASQFEIEEHEEKHAARVALLEKLHTAEARRIAEGEKASASERRAAAAELRASHSDERLEMTREELHRREARLAALSQSLGAAEEELSLLRASKELLAARVQLQEELGRQRQVASTEEVALQTALAMVKERCAPEPPPLAACTHTSTRCSCRSATHKPAG